ncbi:hypothetical protein J437_LFUL009754 [Ladona fulva]|uniref:RRM domain-containing protein n=1 Tax=Ladona fulva TaxID=123851 RepID=A0A8K0K9Y5_LADFU|nr:hypothetical protein J437_LFUL009754 [Ladona fulva]
MYCEVCKMHIVNNQTWEEHILGVRHQSSLKAVSEGTGIFIRGIDDSFKHQDLKSFFSRFGKIEEINMNKRRMFAIIEFSKRESAELALSREIILHGKRLRIFPRKVHRIPQNTNSVTASTSTASKEEDNEESYVVPAYIPVDAFDVDLEKFVRYVEAKEMNCKVNMLCQSLKLALSSNFPGCQIYPFGSSVTGLAVKDSDVDIFVDLGDKVTVEAASNIVTRIKFMLNKFSEFSKTIAIPKAKVPIVKCFHKSTKLQCDINFQNPFGIHNSNLIKFFISLEPRLRNILMVLKYWAKTHELSGNGHLTSYAVVMLLFYYLQQLPNPILPTVQKLQSLCKEVLKVEDWECHFRCNIEDLDRKFHVDSSLQVLLDFFSFYSLFTFEEKVILLRLATAIPRNMIVEPQENSPWFEYKTILEKANAQLVNLDKPMSVLDPFVLNHNITAGMGLRDTNRFQIFCYKAAEMCSKIKSGEVSNLQALFVANNKNQAKYPFFLESWKDNGDVNLIIPVSSFNPKNTFEDSKSEPDTSDDAGKLKLLIEHVTNIFEKVFRFVFVRTDSYLDDATPGRQVIKKENMVDVHSNTGGNKVEQCVYFYSSFYQVWNDRNNSYRQFSFPITMNYIEKEMHVTNFIVETFYKGSMEGLKQTDLKCIFTPYMENRCLQLQLILCGGCKSMKQITTFLLTILQKWLDK